MQRIGATSSQASGSNAPIENPPARDARNDPARPARSPVLDNLRPRHASRSADRDEGSSSSQARLPAIAPAHLPLAGYLYARASIRKAVDARDAASLIAAQDSLAETRAILSRGRGNVIDDNRKTNFDAAGRSHAALEGERMFRLALQPGTKDELGARLVKMLPREEVTALTNGAKGKEANVGRCMALAASSIVNRSGYCDPHAYVSLVQHAPRMGLSEMLTIVGSDSPFPHMWTNVERRLGKGQQVMLDAWADGPAVLAEDSRRQGPHVALNALPRQPGEPRRPTVIGDVTLELAFVPNSAQLFARGVGKMANAMQNDRKIVRTFNDIASRMTSKWVGLASRPGWKLETARGAYAPMPVLSDAFVGAAREAWTQPAHATDLSAPVMEDIRTAGVARHLGLDVRAATRDATLKEIRDASKALIDAAARRG